MSIKYEDIFLNLQSNMEALKRYYSKHINECVAILNSSKNMVYRQENRFIPEVNEQTAMKRFERIKNSYTNFDHIKGEIGTINSTDQYDAIRMMCFSALVYNRIAKILESNERINKKEIYKNYTKKNEEMTNVLANIYVLEYTDEFYKDYFLY